jgi:GNAT superfamily N-acetyltransferase
MGFSIRPFEERDVVEWVEILNQDTSDPATPEHILKSHRSDAELPVSARLVAELDGRVVGFTRLMWLEPGRLWCLVKVHRDYRGRGIGKHLAKAIEPYILPHKPTELFTFIEDPDHQKYHTWAEGFGLEPVGRQFISRLDLSSFDANKFEADLKRVEAQGIQIIPVEPPLDEATAQRLHRLGFITLRDDPSGDNVPEGFEDFARAYLHNNKWKLVGWLIAAQGEEWVGLTGLWRSWTSDDELMVYVTGVLAGHRGKGIGKALTVHGALYAKNLGFQTISTGNDTRNAPMLAINTALGFVSMGGGWSMKRRLD